MNSQRMHCWWIPTDQSTGRYLIYLHGTEDRVVPFEMSRQLYEKAPSPKRLKLILGGGHNNSARVGGAEYLNTVREFIAQVHERS